MIIFQPRGLPMTPSHRTLTHGQPSRPHCLLLGIAILVCGVVVVPSVSAQLLERPLAFSNARILTMDGRVIDDGTLLVKGERIVALGVGVDIPLLAQRIKLEDATITPGLVDAFSALGRSGSPQGTASSTRRAEDAFDQYDKANLVEALRNGVTAVYVSPGGPIGVCGTGAVVRLGQHGPERFGRVLKSEAALCIDLGSSGKPIARLKTLQAVEKQFRGALDYRRSLEKYEEDLAEYKKKLKEQAGKKEPVKPKDKPTPPKTAAAAEEPKKETPSKPEEKKKEEDKPKKPARPPRRPTSEIVLRAIDREIPVRLLAHRSDDILNALELAEEFSFDLILEGATEAHLVADQIADAKVPVVLGRMDHSGVRRNDVFRRAVWDQGAALDRAGVSWIVGSGPTAGRARFLAQNAQLAAAHNGADDPLKLASADAADMLKVNRHIGRLRPGMLADFVVWSGDPLDPASKVLRVYVGGALVYERADETEKGNDE